MKPHKVQGWLNRKEENPEEFQKQSEAVCQTYLDAPTLAAAEQTTHTVSVDEKTAPLKKIRQALERAAPDLPMRPGYCAKREYEYIRHGTLCLIAASCVVSDKAFPWMNETRTEEDFAFFIWMLLATDPNANWIMVSDNFSIVFFGAAIAVNRWCDLSRSCVISRTIWREGEEWGAEIDGEPSGIFVGCVAFQKYCTPKHRSRLNQIEIWFGIICRRLLNRSSFRSLEEMRNKVLSFIDYFNETLAKPFRWTFTGTPLKQ